MSRLLDIFNEENDDFKNQFIKKYEISKNEYIDYLKKYNQVDIYGMIDEIKNGHDFNILKDKLLNIKTDYLYKSFGHGLSHNEKVMLFSLYIAEKENISDEYKNLLLDAAAYHDIGRIHDYEDESHGKRSAIGIKNIIHYNDTNKEDILRFIVHAHSLSDKKINELIDEYNINNEYRDIATKLANILKDADALDRARLDKEDRLNPKYLRTDTSKKMLKVAHQVNECYYSKIYEPIKM